MIRAPLSDSFISAEISSAPAVLPAPASDGIEELFDEDRGGDGDRDGGAYREEEEVESRGVRVDIAAAVLSFSVTFRINKLFCDFPATHRALFEAHTEQKPQAVHSLREHWEEPMLLLQLGHVLPLIVCEIV